MSATMTPRTKLKKQILTLLGTGMVEVELDDSHLTLAIDMAVERIRQRSQGALEESSLFLTLQTGQTEYILPSEVQEVVKLYRRGVGAGSSGGTNFDPFEAAFSNIYLLQAGRTGGLATWDLFSQYQETIGRIFGAEINFTWDHSSRKLTIIRKVRAEENVLIKVFNTKPEHAIINDFYTGPWIRDFALAQAKMMLGEARSKYVSGLPGAQGAVILNGEQLKQEALADLERLENEILNFTTGSDGWGFTIG